MIPWYLDARPRFDPSQNKTVRSPLELSLTASFDGAAAEVFGAKVTSALGTAREYLLKPLNVYIDGSGKGAEAAQHIQDHIDSGGSTIGIVDRLGGNARRRSNTKRLPTSSVTENDEVPPSVLEPFSTKQKVSVRPIPNASNSSGGGQISHGLRGVPNGTVVRILPRNLQE